MSEPPGAVAPVAALTAAARVLARVRAVADPRAVVEAYGSSVYAPAHASDVDVLVSNDDPARLAAALGLTPIPTTPPRMHGTLEGVAVDVTVVTGDDDVARRMRAGPRDAALLAAHLGDHGRDEVFQAAWPHVRQFVRARALGHNGLGWFGSFGWALLLAVPLVTDRELREAPVGAAVPAWLRWLSRLALGARVGLDGTRGGEPEPFFLAAPAPPARDVARLSRRAAVALFAEASAAVRAIGDAATDADALARIADLADDPPAGTTLIIAGTDEHTRGRYDGIARGLVRELETLGAIRSWGRFDRDDDGGWQHRITVPVHRAQAARTLVANWLALTRLDAALE
ncbi:MAG: hypothetical protein NT062_27210 [Proteobacteria bacterium]|nr:hypothetical protein [Pseudomonadota bacterium]